MGFVNYNDYEILYLIRDGSEQAFSFLFKKYDVLIVKLAYDYYDKGDKREDLIQEARMVLLRTIRLYRMDSSTSFYLYFIISCKRMIKKLVTKDYYTGNLRLEDNRISYNNDTQKSWVMYYADNMIKGNNVDKLIYENSIIGNVSLNRLSKMSNIKVSHLRYRKRQLLEELKKLLTNEVF